MDDVRLKLFERALQSCERDYAEKVGTFQQIDDKAQSTAMIAGILVAACVAFVQEETVKRIAAAVGFVGPLLIAAAIVMSLISICCSLICMRAREIQSPLESDELSKMVADLIELPHSELTSKRLENLARDEIRIWQLSVSDHAKKNTLKVSWLLAAQYVLAGAFLVVTIVVLMFLWTFH